MSFYEFLRRAPFIRIILPFIIGILTSRYLQLPFLCIFIILGSVFIVFLFVYFLKVSSNFRFRWIWGLVLHVFLFFSGFLAEAVHSVKEIMPDYPIVATGTILENPKVTASSYHIMVKLEAIKEQGRWKSAHNKVLVTLQKSNKEQKVVLKKRILLRGSWKEIRNNGNPFEFDYKTYMSRNGFYYSAYIDSSNWRLLRINSEFNLTLWALHIRDNILGYFKQLHLSASAFAVVSALTVGDKSYLDPELKATYVNSGTMHILAVSGMHVALLFWLLQQITRPLMFWNRGKLVRAIIVLMIIWVYALITGLTPSVVRASVMFTFWMIGDAGNRDVNIYNTLSASALFLLIINPDILFDVGFQLSYLAVLGIVVFYRDIYNWLYIRYKIFQYFWSMIAVSLAAQLFTLPVTLYAFHQFPNYFLMSNIVALPLSTIILYGSIIALIVAPFKFLWIPIGWLLKIMVDLMNNILIWIEHLPHSVTSNIWLSGFMAAMLFLLVIFIRVFLYRKQLVFIFLALCCCIGISVNILFHQYSTCHSHDIIVYNTHNSLVLQMRSGRNNYIISDDSVLNIERLIKPVNSQLNLKDYERFFWNSSTSVTTNQLMIYRGFICFQDKRLFIWDKEPKMKKIPVDVDLLIIYNIKPKNIYWVKEYFHAKEIIVSNNVFNNVARKLKASFDKEEIPCTVLSTDGAWILSNMKKIDK